MSKNISNKKALAEQIKTKLNSLEYVAMSDLITYDDRHGNMLTWIWGGKSHENDNWISGTNINPGKGNKHESEHIVMRNELEKDDWEEIVNLIEKRNKEKEQIYNQKKRNIEDKLNRQSNLYYYWGQPRRERRADVWVEDKGMRGYVTLLGGQGNGLTYYLYIAENHPILDNFPFQTGFYSIETDRLIEKSVGCYNGYGSTGGKSNPFNFHKWVEVGDQITITPYQVEINDKPSENQKRELEPKGKFGCDTCHKKLGRDWGGSDNFYIIKRYHGKVNIGGPVIWTCLNCYPAQEQEYLQNYETVWERYLDKDGIVDYRQIKFSFIDCYEGKKDPNGQVLKQENCRHCQPWKHYEIPSLDNKEIVNILIEYFQKHSIKKIKLVNGNLVIKYNNKNISPIEKNNSQEFQLAKSVIEKFDKQELSREELSNLINNANTTPTNQPNNHIALWIGMGGILVLMVGIVVVLLRKKTITSKSR